MAHVDSQVDTGIEQRSQVLSELIGERLGQIGRQVTEISADFLGVQQVQRQGTEHGLWTQLGDGGTNDGFGFSFEFEVFVCSPRTDDFQRLDEIWVGSCSQFGEHRGEDFKDLLGGMTVLNREQFSENFGDLGDGFVHLFDGDETLRDTDIDVGDLGGKESGKNLENFWQLLQSSHRFNLGVGSDTFGHNGDPSSSQVGIVDGWLQVKDDVQHLDELIVVDLIGHRIE
ncbi:hypothetical protein WICPIJ_007180 [Wickerhamomyces pijperi]|uniref:Uncharacterized protein n=1 Tax=Wickerhamomyces pijperi TaxID=599730 RepID=A0A9P8TK86_WICPI|nr:hypothetical protein WICPIJ_007180 [Wickerhamomyces pijperi]